MKTSCLLVILAVLILTCRVSARTWYITPEGTGDAPTIQAGIDSATSGDTVLVAAGTYSEACRDTLGVGASMLTVWVDIVLVGENGAEATVLDAQGTCRVIGNFGGATVSGFTIIGGYTEITDEDLGGGGILCLAPGAKVEHCIFSGNYAPHGSAISTVLADIVDCAFSGHGGWSCVIGGGTVTGCLFTGSSGACIMAPGLSAGWWQVTDCVFCRNEGPAVWVYESGSAFVTGCTVYGSDDEAFLVDGGWYHENPSVLQLDNTIVACGQTAVLCRDYVCEVTLSCCCLWANENGDYVGCVGGQEGVRGNFSACPSFCSAAVGDFSLCDESPCLPGNHPDGTACGLIGALGEGCSCGPSRTESSTWGSIKSMYE
jgi:hypothetical protein